MKEYIVTLKNKEDLENFYHDMETLGGSLYIPDRRVECCCRRSISRNTHYMLTKEEAEAVGRDPRVASVERNIIELGAILRPSFTQTSNQWSRSILNIASNDLNHGLLRTFEGENRLGWNGTTLQRVSGTIESNREGYNVDVIILDGDLDKNHPEFAFNPDGTGGSRVIEYNWFSLNPIVDPDNTLTQYLYNIFNTQECYHGHHVAGIAVGNTQGAGKKCNIYNLNPYPEKNINIFYLFDYIRAFHNSKPINPETGVKNPTLVNASIELIWNIEINSISTVYYRGLAFNSPFSYHQLKDLGIADKFTYPSQTYISVPVYSPSIQADIEDAIEDGVLIIVSAGNGNLKIDKPSGPDFNNILVSNGNSYYYHRGGIPNLPDVSILVGSATFINDPYETRAAYTNTGSGIDVFAPGDYITSSTLSGDPGVVANDFRNSEYKIVHKNGTSQAAPQACGIAACVLEKYKSWNQNNLRNYISTNSKLNQLYVADNTSAFDAAVTSGSYIRSVINLPDGSLIIGGSFTQVNGITRNRIAKLNSDGSLDMAFNPNANSTVSTILRLSDDSILIGGYFTSIGGVTRTKIAKLNSDGTLSNQFDLAIATGWVVNDLKQLPDGTILVAGNFDNIGGVLRNGIAKLNIDGTVNTGFLNALATYVQTIKPLNDGAILIGGLFTFAGANPTGAFRDRIAKLNSDGTLVSSFNASVRGGIASVNDLELQNDNSIIIAGGFTEVNGVTRNCIAKLNSDGTLNTNFTTSVNNTIYVLKILNDNSILIGGDFSTVNGTTRTKLAKLNSDGTLSSDFNFTLDGTVEDICVLPDNSIIVVGWFSTFGASNKYKIAKLSSNGQLWAATLGVDLNDAPNKFLYFNSAMLESSVFLKNNKLLFKDGKLLVNKQ